MKRSELQIWDIVFSSSFWQLLGIYMDLPVELFWSLKEKIDPPPFPESSTYYFLSSPRSGHGWGGEQETATSRPAQGGKGSDWASGRDPQGACLPAGGPLHTSGHTLGFTPFLLPKERQRGQLRGLM